MFAFPPAAVEIENFQEAKTHWEKNMKSRVRSGLSALVVAALVASGCGGSDPDDQTSPPQTDALGRIIGGGGELTTLSEDENVSLSEEDLADIAAVEEAGPFQGAVDIADITGVPEGFDEQGPVDAPTEGDADTPAEPSPIEPGSDTPVLEEVLEASSLTVPCDIFDEADLGPLLTGWAESDGVLDEINSAVGADGPIVFDQESGGETQCDWFSNSHVWFIGMTWEPADPTYLGVLYESLRDRPGVVPVGDGAGFVTDGTSAQLSVDGLFITITNAMPVASSIEGAEGLTIQLAQAVLERVRP